MTRYFIIILITVFALTACGEDSKTPVSADPIDNNEQPKKERVQIMPLAVGNEWNYVRNVDNNAKQWTDVYSLIIQSKQKRYFEDDEVDAYYTLLHIDNLEGYKELNEYRLLFAHGEYIYMTSELTKTNLKYYDVQEHIARYECQSDKLILDGVAYDMGKKSIEFNGKLFEADTYEYQDNNESVKQTTIFGVGLYSYDFVSPYYSFDLKLEKAIIK